MRFEVGRVRDVLLAPRRAWRAIAEAPEAPSRLARAHVAPLAAIPALCGLFGAAVVGERWMGVVHRPGLAVALGQALMGFGLMLAGVWLMAQAANLLAPLFGGVRDFRRAFNLVAYAGTPAWLLGVFLVAPAFSLPVVTLGALWSLVLLHLGLPRLMRPEPDKAVSYFAALLLTGLTLAVLFGIVTSLVRGPPLLG